MNYLIRAALLCDVPNICDFIDSHYRKDYFMTKAQIERCVDGKRFKRKPLPNLIALEGSIIVGFALKSRKGALINLLVHPDFRNLGIGENLLKALNPDFVRVKTNVFTGDPSKYYEKLGYSFLSTTSKSHIKTFVSKEAKKGLLL